MNHQLEDLFVDEAYRGKGVGKAFFVELANVAQEKVRIGCLFSPSCPYAELAYAELRADGLVRTQGWCQVYVSLVTFVLR